MTTIIIHDRGEPWELASPFLRHNLRCPPTVFDLADFAVNERGFVVLTQRSGEAIEVRLRPSIVNSVALAKAAEVLGASEGRRVVVISPCDDGTFLSGRIRAIEQLMDRATTAQSIRAEDFRAQRFAIPAAASDASFGLILQAWHASPGTRSQTLMDAVRRASRGRFLEVAPNYASGRLVIDAVGEGYTLYGKGWKSVAVGGRFEDMPDFEYARWAARSYREASLVRQPIMEDIAACVDLPTSGRTLLAYRRVILPLGHAGERPSLLLGATLDQRVTRLALDARDEPDDVV